MSTRLSLSATLLFALGSAAHAQQKPVLITATDYKGSGVILEAQNTGVIPYTLLLTCDLVNMDSSAPLPLQKVLEPSKKKIIVARLTPFAGYTYNWKYTYRYFPGRVLAANPSPEYAYTLPFEADKEYMVIQTGNGLFSHLGRQAVDFSMPENSVVCAARAGIVADVKQDSNISCPTKDCQEQANRILIYHADGTYATYLHFRQNGSLVQPGQQVVEGQPIGYSGNTGWSSGPHLHFEVGMLSESGPTTVPTVFRVGDHTEPSLQLTTRYKR